MTELCGRKFAVAGFFGRVSPCENDDGSGLQSGVMDRRELIGFVRARGLGVIASCGPNGSPQAALVGSARILGGTDPRTVQGGFLRAVVRGTVMRHITRDGSHPRHPAMLALLRLPSRHASDHHRRPRPTTAEQLPVEGRAFPQANLVTVARARLEAVCRTQVRLSSS